MIIAGSVWALALVCAAGVFLGTLPAALLILRRMTVLHRRELYHQSQLAWDQRQAIYGARPYDDAATGPWPAAADYGHGTGRPAGNGDSNGAGDRADRRSRVEDAETSVLPYHPGVALGSAAGGLAGRDGVPAEHDWYESIRIVYHVPDESAAESPVRPGGGPPDRE